MIEKKKDDAQTIENTVIFFQYFFYFDYVRSNLELEEVIGLIAEKRITRLEEKVFGTIHDIDIKTRYNQLRKAFDAEKTLRRKHKLNSLSGFPTSTPVSFDNLTD